ncbi:MAG: hypothetical protein Kow0060_04090 [Methylohalobius crimeensis]
MADPLEEPRNRIQVERLIGPEHSQRPAPTPLPWYRSRRLQIFAIATSLVLLIGLAVVFLRPPIYRASASLLTTSPPAADHTETIVDPQHVAIQQVLLTGQPLLVETRERLEWEGFLSSLELDPEDLKNMLAVHPTPDTNLVELRAEGPKRDLLAPLVNTWIDVYMATRAREIQATTGATLVALNEQLTALDEKIAAKRRELETFRQRYDIASLERSENDVLARLRGLNETMNQVSEEAVKAKARLEAIREAIAADKPVVPDSEERVLATLVSRAQALREELTALKQRFTPDYIRLNPAYSKVPEQLREVEEKIRRLVGEGQQVVLTQAEQAYASARQAVAETRRQLDEHKQLASEFSTRFAQHETLIKELEQMEARQREFQDRITQLEVKQSAKYPPVEVVERAYRPKNPIRPHYWRDAGWVTAASVGFGLLAVWLAEYLTRQETDSANGTGGETRLTLAGVHVYAKPETSNLLNRVVQDQAILEEASPPPQLETPFPRELSRNELESLLANADLRTRQSIALLLSGLTPDETLRLNATHLDLSQDKLFPPPPHRRALSLAPRLKTWLAASGGAPLVPAAEEELAKLIYLAAVEAGLRGGETITPEAIRHTYLLYIVRQGLKLAELENIAGPMPLTELSAYGRLAPPEATHSLDEIQQIHPCLRI